MTTLTPLRPLHSAIPRHPAASVLYHGVQAAWLAAMVAWAISAGPTLGFVVLWLVGAGVIATLGFGCREYVLHDHPSSSL